MVEQERRERPFHFLQSAEDAGFYAKATGEKVGAMQAHSPGGIARRMGTEKQDCLSLGDPTKGTDGEGPHSGRGVASEAKPRMTGGAIEQLQG